MINFPKTSSYRAQSRGETMTMAFTRVSYWLWGGKDHEVPNLSLSSSSDFPSGYREPDSLKFPSANGTKMRSSSSRRIGRKWRSREERRIDREYDIVLVPSDGVCMSGSESDDSDWSVGWLEPHGPDFDSDTENSFAVLVPCYGRGRCEKAEGTKKGGAIGAAVDCRTMFSDGKDYLDQWLSSLQNT
ncbi:Uncharacterized protein M6B38_227970 [Iris pallida]|uniref:Uncharacterized protein n=1 Tax=Iris pallida TaxID=29817 RepID=A0AAX6DSV9_IRIPA|nr:Uncharacterized protein M6B38_227970 [Iris pallida]